MENRNIILNELMDISPVVAAIGNQNLYTIPATYFDGFAMQVMMRIALEEKAGTDPALNINKGNVYQAPEHYFENLSANILNRIKAEQTPSAKDELELLSPLLGQIGKKTPFASPEGYFKDFSENIMAGVKAVEFVNEELENLSPVMLELKNKQVYEAPAGYFDTLAAAVLKKAKTQQPAKVIKIGFARRTIRYAAAAAITGIVILSAYFYSGSKPVLNAELPGIAKVTDADIENFLDDNTNTLADLGTDSYSGADTTTKVTTGEINADDSKDLLADISDEELQKYADQQTETPLTN